MHLQALAGYVSSGGSCRLVNDTLVAIPVLGVPCSRGTQDLMPALLTSRLINRMMFAIVVSAQNHPGFGRSED
jgi:hypothetical protein